MNRARLVLENCNIEAGVKGIVRRESTIDARGRNLSADPRFLDPGDPNGKDNRWGTLDDGLRLRPGSPCIRAGTAQGAPLADISGEPLPENRPPDLGAYRFLDN